MNRLASTAWFSRLLTRDITIIGLLVLILFFPNSGFKNAVIWSGLLGLVLFRRQQDRPLHMGGLGPIIALYIGVSLLACFFSQDVWFSIRQWLKLLELVAGYTVIVNMLSTSEKVETNVRRYFLAVGILALVDLGRFAWSAWHQHDVLIHGRWFDSLLGYPTIASGIYAASLLLGLPVFFHARRQRQPILTVLCLLMFMGLIVLLYLLQTRSVLLGFACGVMAILVLAPLPRRYQAGLIAASVLVLAAFVSIPGTFRDRIFSGQSSDRTAIWQDIDRIIDREIAEEPYRLWIGFGYGHKIFEGLHEELPDEKRTAQRVYNHAHNMFLETRIQSGYIGLVAWISLMVMAAYRMAFNFPVKAQPRIRLVAACLAASAISFFIYGLFSLFFAMTPALFFWTLLATCMASCRNKDDEATLANTPA